jgi:hypothetical protein
MLVWVETEVMGDGVVAFGFWLVVRNERGLNLVYELVYVWLNLLVRFLRTILPFYPRVGESISESQSTTNATTPHNQKQSHLKSKSNDQTILSRAHLFVAA